MANTDKYLAHSNNLTGYSISTPASAWGYSAYTKLVGRTQQDIQITHISFQMASVLSVDVTYEIIFEIAKGDQGHEILLAQVPFSARNDTAASFYYMPPRSFYFPETLFVPEFSRLKFRIADSNASAISYDGIKIGYQIPQNKHALIEDNQMPNNYQFTQSVSDNVISITEKIR